MEYVEERIESEDMVIDNIDNSFNKLCYERKKANRSHPERNLGSREYHEDLKSLVVFCPLVLLVRCWFILLSQLKNSMNKNQSLKSGGENKKMWKGKTNLVRCKRYWLRFNSFWF